MGGLKDVGGSMGSSSRRIDVSAVMTEHLIPYDKQQIREAIEAGQGIGMGGGGTVFSANNSNSIEICQKYCISPFLYNIITTYKKNVKKIPQCTCIVIFTIYRVATYNIFICLYNAIRHKKEL